MYNILLILPCYFLELKRNIVQDNHEVVNDNLQAHTEAELQWLEREKLAQEEFAEKQKIKEENRRKHFENLAKKRAEKAKLVEEWQSQLFRIEAEFDKLLENDDDIPVDGFDDFETRPGKKVSVCAGWTKILGGGGEVRKSILYYIFE